MNVRFIPMLKAEVLRRWKKSMYIPTAACGACMPQAVSKSYYKLYLPWW